jgi:uncharacterized protein (TIGR03118 family)
VFSNSAGQRFRIREQTPFTQHRIGHHSASQVLNHDFKIFDVIFRLQTEAKLLHDSDKVILLVNYSLARTLPRFAEFNQETARTMSRPTLTVRWSAFLLLTASFVLAFGGNALAQYTLTSLVNTSQDPNLKNAWGLAYLPGGPFWVSDEHTGVSTLYDGAGTILPTVVTVPSATAAIGSPTGIVGNSTTGFVVTQNGVSGPALFIFDTLDGTLSGWNPSVNATSAVVTVNNHSTANYTGLAIGTFGTKTLLYAANQAKNRIEIFDSTFKMVKTFTDANLTGLKVYGVSVLNGRVFVTFSGATTGAVDVFTTSGTFVKTLIPPTTTLKGPWGMALAPRDFGTLSGTLLVGNVNDGRINAFNKTTGALVGPIKDTSNKAISIPGLWGLLFGGGSSSNGNTNQLFFAAGTGGYATGEFGVINP